MTPMACATPLSISRDPLRFPLKSAGTLGPCVMTVMIMTSMLINANVDAFASLQSVSSPYVEREPQ